MRILRTFPWQRFWLMSVVINSWCAINKSPIELPDYLPLPRRFSHLFLER